MRGPDRIVTSFTWPLLIVACALTTPEMPSCSALRGISGLTIDGQTTPIATGPVGAAGGAGGAGGGGGAITGGVGGGVGTEVMAGAVDGGGVTSGGGMNGGGGGASIFGGLISLGGGGGGGGGGGSFTSWITVASSGFLITSTALRARPETSAQPTSICTPMTSATPLARAEESC